MTNDDFERELLMRKINQTLNRMTIKELEALAYELETKSLCDEL